MNKNIPLTRNLISFLVPTGLFGVLIILMKASFLSGSNTLSMAITADLLLTVPIVYFLLIRKSNIPKTTVIPVMIVGLLIGSFLLPKDSQAYLNMFKTWALPVIELLILTFIVIKVRSAIKKYKKLTDSSPDFFSALKSTCREILPKPLVLPFATEIAVIYYGFINWRTRAVNENEFTYHKKSGTPALLGAFVFIIGIETLALHLLLARWNIVAAWIFSGLSIYTAMQILGFAKSLSKRPVLISPDSLVLRYGIMNEAEVSFSDIESVELSNKQLKQDDITRTLSPLGEIERHNLVITLKKENTLTGIYGIKKRFKVLFLHIDEPAEFKEKINKALQQ